MRLDQYLCEQKFVNSRSKASELIKQNKVLVNNKTVNKNSYEVKEKDCISLKENDVLKYVSRGGLKLEKALNEFNIDITDLIICDIGASTGGFTDCCLKNNAKFVYSIDVGTNQLHESLKSNLKVKSIENMNFKNVELSLFDDKIDLYVCDVSFISIRTILTKLKSIQDDFKIIILFKPQFEVGKQKLNKNGVVKNKNYIIDALNDFKTFLEFSKMYMHNFTFSPICGNKEGNIEFLAYIDCVEGKEKFDFERIVNEAIKVLKVEKC